MTGNSQEENTMSLMDITLDKLRQIKQGEGLSYA